MPSSHFSSPPSSHKENVAKLIAFDKIRIYKILELFQYSVIFLFIAILLSKGIDSMFTSDDETLKKTSTFVLHVDIVIISFVYCVISYYIYNFAHIIPSVMNLIDKDFVPHTTLNYSIHIVFIVVFAKMNTSLVSRLKRLNYVHT